MEKRERHKTPPAKCIYCGKEFSKGTMTRHLEACKDRQAAIAAEKGAPAKLLHLRIAGTYATDYWMHIEIPASATLAHLDDFLRDTWVECCGHLSQFIVEGRNHQSHTESGKRSMKSPLEKVFAPGMTVGYEYDFGSTTELTIDVIAEREGKAGKSNDITVMARNEAPVLPCGACGKNPAVVVCMECSYGPEGWLCLQCALKHEHMDSFLPVVNSPRTGVCGYDGGVDIPEALLEGGGDFDDAEDDDED